MNLTSGGIDTDGMRMRMSSMVRESMLHVGVSNMYRGTGHTGGRLMQAVTALEYGQNRVAPIWYCEFRNCVLEYWLQKGLGKFEKNTIISGALPILRDYDREHGTELYNTLKTYLYYERNSTLTAKVLKLHRSTLPHRLERIMRLTGLNLDDYRTRMYLNMSFLADEG